MFALIFRPVIFTALLLQFNSTLQRAEERRLVRSPTIIMKIPIKGEAVFYLAAFITKVKSNFQSLVLLDFDPILELLN